MTTESFWPEPDAFLDIAAIQQETDGRVLCTAVAICDADGNPALSFYQGQAAHFFYEFEILEKIQVPCGGLDVHRADGLVIHGKNSFQYGIELPQSVEPGQRLRFHQEILLDVGPGHYWITAGLVSTDETSHRNYSSGAIGHEQFSPVEHCRVADVGSFAVRFDEQGKLRHHGLANLEGNSRIAVMPAEARSSSRTRMPGRPEVHPPTIIHVTHWKAGSQWIHKILNECAPERVVAPKLNQSQFLTSPIQPGKIFPTVYVTKSQFDRTHLPPNTYRFVVIRDLRDTLVSGYFSMKVSHQTVGNELSDLRPVLQQLSQEDGMLYMIDNWLEPCAAIQRSWLEAAEPLIRYENLLERDFEVLETVLVERCKLSIEPERFMQAVLANRFEQVTGGRERGNEDIAAHERKGIAGDWQNFFTNRVKQAFKNRYGGLLVATGYAHDLNW